MVIYYYFSYTRFPVPVYVYYVNNKLDDIPRDHSIRHKSVLLIRKLFFNLYLFIKTLRKTDFTHYIYIFGCVYKDFTTIESVFKRHVFSYIHYYIHVTDIWKEMHHYETRISNW